MFRRLLLTAFAFFLAMPFSVSAQEVPAPSGPPVGAPSFTGSQIDAPEDTVDCFDSYKFGSVQVDVSPSVASAVPGIPITFSGEIRNANPYPIIGGAVYAKVFKKQTDDELAHRDGHLLVDQFVVKKDVTLKANGEEPIVFDWNIPRFAPSGDYEVAMFFYTADRFNLLGLTFTDDVVGNKASFAVKSDVEGEVAFDKNKVTLNGKEYRFAAFPPRFTKDEPVKAEVKLGNTTEKDQSISLSWTLYNWDSLRSDNRIDEKTETVVLKAGETKALSYETTEYRGAVSFLVVEAEANGQKSILDIRWVREGVSETRINFPSIVKFPLTAGEANGVFACAHSTNLPFVENSEIALTLKDQDGKTIHAYTYRGGITGAMMGVRDDFIPEKAYDRFTLSTVLKKDGQVVEALDLHYDCERIDSSLCSDGETGLTGNKGSDTLGGPGEGVLFGLLAVIVSLLGLLSWKLWKDRKSKRGVRTFSFLFAMILSAGLLFGGAEEAEAKSVVWNTTSVPELYYYWNSNDKYPNHNFSFYPYYGWANGLNNSNVSITYKARLFYKGTSTEILDGVAVVPGTQIEVVWGRDDADISWFGTGYSADSPFGTWQTNASDPVDYCNKYFVSTAASAMGSWDVYIPLSVNPPAMSVSGSNVSCSGNVCTVTGAGPVALSAVFPATYGKFYYRYYGNGIGGSGCYVQPGTPMKACSSSKSWPAYKSCGQNAGLVQVPDNTLDYSLAVPTQTLAWNLTAVAGNNVPNIPTLTHDAVCNTGQSYTLSAQGTDPDGDQVYYAFDINNDGVADGRTPGASFVNSGALSSLTLMPAAGVYQVRARAVDSRGGVGGWSVAQAVSCAVAIPAPTFTFTANPTSIVAGNSSLLSWTTTNAAACWLSGGGIGSWPTLPTGNRSVSPAVTTTYSLECWNASGVSSGVQSRTVTVTAPTYSCTGTIPANASMFANDNVGLSVNTPYTYWPTDTGTRCQYSCNGGYNWNGSACVPPVSTLKVCLNSCNSGSNNFNGQTVDLAPNDTRRYVACYNAASGCNSASGDITADASTTFSATDTPSDAVNPTATKGEFRANTVPVTRSESVSVGTSQGSASVTLRVTPVCVSGCSAQAGNHCQGETFTTTNSCGAPETCTNAGTRYCDFNWKEVAPGN